MASSRPFPQKPEDPQLPGGYYRCLMKQTLHARPYYGQRWQAECGNSMIKRNQGEFILGHTAWSRRRELRLAIITHNVAIVVWVEVLYGACRTTFFTTKQYPTLLTIPVSITSRFGYENANSTLHWHFGSCDTAGRHHYLDPKPVFYFSAIARFDRCGR